MKDPTTAQLIGNEYDYSGQYKTSTLSSKLPGDIGTKQTCRFELAKQQERFNYAKQQLG